MAKQLPCDVCGAPVDVPAKYGRALTARHGHCKPVEPKAKATWNELFWGVINRLLKLTRSFAKPLLAGSAGFGAAWGFFEYGSILGVIGGAITFPCLLCGLFTVPAAFFWIAWGTWDGFKSLIRWLDRVLDVPESNTAHISEKNAVPHNWADEMLTRVVDERDIERLKRAKYDNTSLSLPDSWHLMSLLARYKKMKGID